MAASETTPKLVRFGVFEADLEGHELRKSGRKIKLQEQPFQVLALLLQRPGEIVDREHLQQAVWPDGTFVEFDRSLNTAIKKIRQALSDSAENPRFLETLPRKGYRFIAPVSCATPTPLAPAPPTRTRRTYLIAAMIGIGLAALAAALLLVNRHRPQESVGETVPFATYPGILIQPSFSPDGERVAFTWNGPAGDNFDIYVKQIGNEGPLRLTTDPALDSRPAWSPDGRLVAFIRELPDGRLGILVAPSIGGPEKTIAETRRAPTLRSNSVPAWTPDGKWLAFPDRDADNTADQTSSIYALRLDTGERRRLTHAPAGNLDLTGAFSGDGNSLLFRRMTSTASEVYLLRLSSDLRPAEEPVRLTSDGRFIGSASWARDGREILYVSLRSNTAGTVWRMPVSPGARATQITALGDHVWTLAVSGKGNRVVYARTFLNRDIWRMELSPTGRQTDPPIRLIASSVPNSSPAYSPDGKKIAFGSARSGHNELWICASDGSDPLQLTFLKRGQTGPPRWSPDGKRIFFDSSASGRFSIYVIDSDGRNLRQLTNGPADDALPSLSADGRSIYFSSKRSGRWEIWKIPVEGGEAAPVTSNGGWIAFESPDGKYLNYAKNPGAGSLWRRLAAGGPEQAVATPVLGNSLAVSPRGICFARPAAPGSSDVTGDGNVIERYSFETGQIRTIAKTPRPIHWFLSLSPDERFVLYTETGQAGSDLMLLDNFR